MELGVVAEEKLTRCTVGQWRFDEHKEDVNDSKAQQVYANHLYACKRCRDVVYQEAVNKKKQEDIKLI